MALECNPFVLFRPVDQVDRLGGAGESSVEPAVVVFVAAVLRDEALIYEDVFPLATLGLVACYCIGVFYLECVEIPVFTQVFHTFLLGRDVGIILHYSIEQSVILLTVK